ncbi:deoxyribose-phosphate aldolase [Tenacibaculum sp. S7007]|uniref:Deoxyribose-phosphate aldolase n=1 Tax=Tenacibaculum pelagium TaxID=2759527 RepID=A0A839ALM0_9FLAO|nr:DUF6503 family protein [Tenacibaculum pelagium]MBA6155104.1 deoxyribose-phosphate aldolase [Tenacibaculum pelagium]
MRYFSLLIIVLFMACKSEYTAQQIVDNSINHSKLNKVLNSKMSFDFRKNHYEAERSQGNYEFTRFIDRDSIKIKDILSNNGFQRFINDSLVELSEKDQNRYGNSVNSVHYFSILPVGLNDNAVYKKLLGEVVIKGKEYFKIQITFAEEGGGDDFDDVFIYWFAKDNFQLDYLAYKYHTNGGGIRFRDVKKENFIDGIRFVDYNNYKPLNKEIDFYTIDKLYEEGKLKKVSEIVLENIKLE